MAPPSQATTVPARQATPRRLGSDKVIEKKGRKTIEKAHGRSQAVPAKYRGFRLTRSSLTNDGFDEKYIEDLSKSLPTSSFSTWGFTQQQPVIAPSRKHRPIDMPRRVGTDRPIPNERNDGSSVAIVSCRRRYSHLLKAPLEIRERILSYLLLSQKPILVNYQLAKVLRQSSNSHAILLACRQLFIEASSFLYRSSCFVVILRNRIVSLLHTGGLYGEDKILAPRFLHFLRIVAIDIPRENWGLKWLKQATSCTGRLVDAGAFLISYTLIVRPQRVGLSTTALGIEARPVTFADFLWTEGCLIQAISRLHCQSFNVVVKKSRERQFLMIVRGLQYNTQLRERTALDNEETLRAADDRRRCVLEDLAALKGKFERLFENDAEALELGFCSEIPAAMNPMLGLDSTKGNNQRSLDIL